MSIHICGHCGKPVPDDAAFCPNCGEELTEDIRLTKIPETIEELQDFCAAHQMPLEKMRFFIGRDYKGAKAFGIYKDKDGDCVVYKNKADGSRAVRYKGPDEKHAVRELYEKLKSETELRREAPDRSVTEETQETQDEPLKWWETIIGAVVVFWKPIVIALAAGLVIYSMVTGPSRGYYRYQDETYYYQNNDWYLYSELLDGWERTYDVPEELEIDYDNFYDGRDYDELDAYQFGVSDFTDSDYYESDWDYFTSDSSFDDYDWDWDDDYGSYDSWDSGGTDWDSDW